MEGAGAGRARGLARGRGRPLVQQAPQLQGASRARPAAPSSASSASSSSGTAPPIGRSSARSQSSVTDITRQMQQISLQSTTGDNGSNGDNGNGAPRAIGRGNIRSGRYVTAESLYTRPASVQNMKKGQSGQTVKIQSNFFNLVDSSKFTVYKHHVDFNPAEDRTGIRKSMIKEFANRFGGHQFDGSTLFSVAPVCQENAPLELVTRRQSDNSEVKITIKRVGTVEPGDGQRLQIFNIILRKCLGALNLELIRRNYYDPAAKIPIPEYNLELWPGYVTSIGQYEHGILLNAEINFKVLRKDNALDLFREIYTRNPRDVRNEFSRAIIGNIVLTTYNNKTYRVDDVDYSQSPKSTFPKKTKEGIENVSFANYFERVYGVRIRDPDQPMLISKSNARQLRAGQPELISLVPELCVFTGLTDEMRANYQLMRATAKHTAVNPGERIKRIQAFSERLLREQTVKDTLKLWGMNLTPRVVEIDGRVLPQEDILMANNVQYKSGPDVDWTRNLRNNAMFNTCVLTKWLLVYPIKLEQQARQLFQLLQQVGASMKFTIPVPRRMALQNDHASAYVQEIDKGYNAENPQLIMCLVPNNRADRYSAIKKKCILDKPVPSQVVLQKSVMAKGNMSICTKIAIQMNCKIGGSAWSVSIPLVGLMVVGFDVCHDPKDKRKSYGAMVASLDKSLGRFFSSVKHHSAGEELSTNFGLSLTMAVKRFREVNQALPKKIIIYRDGVGDGNLEYVHEQEVKNIQTEVGKLYPADQPLQMAFVIVTKRINVRLFNGMHNPSPGTIVDDVITNPRRYDFFLVSQSVHQGTVSPTHYNVIADNSDLKPDHMQRLTYKMTHMYFNYSGTVRVPAPCQYAHKLAFLTAQSVGNEHSNLNNLLYFL